MKIKTRLQISSLLAFVLTLLVGLILLVTTVHINETSQKAEAANKIVQKLMELRFATADYLAKPLNSKAPALLSQYDDGLKLLSQNFGTVESNVLIVNIDQNLKSAKSLLINFIKTAQAELSQSDNQAKNILLSKIQNTLSSGSGLNVLQRLETENAQRETNIVTIILIAIIGILIGIISFLIRKTIAEPIAQLYQSVKIISTGNLNYKIGLKNDDEIGELTRAFDEMTAKLKEYYDRLEAKVQERTGELSLKIKELRQAKSKTTLILKKLEKAKIQDEVILAGIGDGMIASNAKGGITFANKAFEDLFGWKKSEIISRNISDIIQIEHEDGTSFTALENPFALGKKLINIHDYFCVRKNKTRFPVSITVSPMVVEGKIVGMIALFRDITKESEINRMKNEFLSFAAHQLRTPLGRLRWNLEMLLEDDFGKLALPIKERLQQMDESNQGMIKLVDELLNIARISEGVWNDKPILINPLPIIETVVREMSIEAKAKKVMVNIDSQGLIGGEIMVDPNHFHEVIGNLLSNSIKFSHPDGGVDISFKQDPKKLQIIIIDHGIGIPKKDQDKLFSKFFRAENAILNETEGTGLGLFMIKSYIEKWGGKVWLESEEGKYTKYYLEFKLP